MKTHDYALLILRVGIAFVFIYAAVASFLTPNAWIGFFPQEMRGIVPDETLLFGFSIFELILGVWLLSGFKLFYASVLASLATLGIIVTNLGAMDIIFRDVTILAACIALAIESRLPQKK